MQTNHASCLLFPLFHNAMPFQTDSQRAIKINRIIIVGVIPKMLYKGLYIIIYFRINITNLNIFSLKKHMDSLISEIEKLKQSEIKEVIEKRMQEFSELGKKDNSEIFNELCFCLLTANFSALGGIKIQSNIGDGFSNLEEQDLANKLAELGHRFPNMRAKFIVESRKHKNNLKDILSRFEYDSDARNWFAENVKGLGMKEASHFMRNIGYKNVAIIDFHILDLLGKFGLIEKPKSKSLTRKRYLEIENVLKQIAKESNTNLGELDLYLWYKETGKVLK